MDLLFYLNNFNKIYSQSTDKEYTIRQITDLYTLLSKVINKKIRKMEYEYNIKIELPKLKEKFFINSNIIKNKKKSNNSDNLYNTEFDNAFDTLNKGIDLNTNEQNSHVFNPGDDYSIMLTEFSRYLQIIIDIDKEIKKYKNGVPKTQINDTYFEFINTSAYHDL
jgi:hypothetical protein